MSTKEKPGVTRRPNRGRSALESKSKTDSGCFVDEELERNGSSDSSQGSISSSPVKEKNTKKAKLVDTDRRTENLSPSVPSSEPTIGNENAPKSTLDRKENVMNEDTEACDKIENDNTENANRVNCDMVEKTQPASDFYCLYYSASPEGTLTRSDVSKLKIKPPVPPKPKIRRGSAPPSSFNNIERIHQQNKDITKRFSYNECQNNGTKLALENFEEGDKRKCFEDRVLFFEALTKNELAENPSLKNVQLSNLKNSSDVHKRYSTEVNGESQNGFIVHDDQHGVENIAPLAEREEFSFQSNNNCESFSLSCEVQEQIAPLVEEEEFTVDGSILFQSSVNCDAADGNSRSGFNHKECLDCVSEIDEVEAADHFVVDENQNGVNVSFHKNDQSFSDQLMPEEAKTGVCTKDAFPENHNGCEPFHVSTVENDHLQDASIMSAPYGNINQANGCSYNAIPYHENAQERDSRENLVNPRLNEIKQELLIGSRQCKANGMQRRPGSIAGISNLERDFTSQMTRRSWSFSEHRPMDINSPFIRQVNQFPAPKVTASSWHSENGFSSPFVRPLQQTRPVQSTPSGINTSQERIGWSSQHRPGVLSFEQSGYSSDDSSVHSEPLFQPMRRRPQSLNRGHIFKSMSVDSSMSSMDNGTPSFSKTQRRPFRHSLGSRDPVYALRRQSFEFAEDSPSFRPIAPVQVPRLQALRRTSSNASSSSDSEVERIFNHPEASTIGYSHFAKFTVHDGLANTTTDRKVSAMEALFGPQSKRTATLSSDSEQLRRKPLSERFPEIPHQPLEDDFFSEELPEEETIEFDETEPKEMEEPGLEFDDTDYSEFYTRCEDKQSIITAEALSIKKLLQSPQTVLPDRDIECVVMSVTERKVLSPSSDDQNLQESQNESCDNNPVDIDDSSSARKMAGQFCRRHRGTQTPSSEVLRALSPPASVGTQTPPLSVSQELLPPSLLKELQKDLQAPAPAITRAISPTTSQEQESPSLEHFRALSPSSVPFADADLLSSLQNSDKAVSVEELIQILANMRLGQPRDTPSRRPVSVQKYNSSSAQNIRTRNSTNSLPRSWHQLNSPTGKQGNGEDFKKPSGVPPRSSKSYDCLRRGMSKRGKSSGVIQAQVVGNRESHEDIRQKLKEWKLRSQLFEEEVECLEDKRKLLQTKGEKVMRVCYDGSESTDNIETESKLTRTHSLKRPRKDRAFSQKDRNDVEASSVNEKRQFSLPTAKADCEKSKDGKEDKDSFTGSEAEDSKFEVPSDSLLADKLESAAIEPKIHEVASPEGVDVFIDYRKKNGKHITSTPKPPPYPGTNLVCREERVGKINLDKPESLENAVKPVCPSTANGPEDIPADAESQGDASSSSYSSDDDRFGEFGGSTDTVVFVDTDPSPGISLVPDIDDLDLKLVGSDNLLSIDNDDEEEEDESRLDVLLGEVRRSLNLEFVDSDILDKAIERFKQRVSPGSQNKALSGGLSMEAYVALHQADELQGIISEIKGELKLLHDENDMLREQVVSLANQQTNGEVTENSSTESSERLEHLCKLYKAKQAVVVTDDEEDTVEVDVCLRGFSVVPLGHLPAKKKDIHLGRVTVKGSDWNGVMEAAKRAFVEHVKKIDPDNYLCLGAHSIQGVQTGVMVWSPGSLTRRSPRVELSQKSNPCVIQLKDGNHFSCDSLVYDTLLPKEKIEKYVEELLEHRYIVLCGEQGLGKSYLAAKLAEHVVQRIGWKGTPAVVTFNVTQATRKELKQKLASLLESNTSSSQDGRPAVIVLDQLNCLASLADMFDFSVLEKDRNCPYIIGVRDKSRRGPFSSKELNLCHYFRWLRVTVKDRQYSGLLGRFLRRKLSWTHPQTDVVDGDLLELFNWLTRVWYHLNGILEEYCEPDSTIGPSVFFSCPMDYKAAEGWFATVWNYDVIPYLHQALRSGRKIFDRCISWEDPTKWVVMRYPWNKDHSRVLHTLRKLRQVDVVLNRNHLGSDDVCFAECIEENEKILRAHSTVSKRVRTVVKQKVPKGELKGKRKTAEQMEFLRYDDDKDSCYSETDSYLETSI